MDLERVFKQLGTTENHAIIYQYLLDKGRSTILTLARDTSIPRSSIYEYLPQLISFGFVKESKEGKSKVYEPQSPKLIEDQLETRLKQVRQDYEEISLNMEELMRRYENTFRIPKVTYLNGKADLRELIVQIVQSGRSLAVYANTTEKLPGIAILSKYEKNINSELREQERQIRELLNYSAKTFSYKQDWETDNHRIALIRHEESLTQNTVKIIWEQYAALIDTNRDTATLISDKELTRHELQQFDYLWSLVVRDKEYSDYSS